MDAKQDSDKLGDIAQNVPASMAPAQMQATQLASAASRRGGVRPNQAMNGKNTDRYYRSIARENAQARNDEPLEAKTPAGLAIPALKTEERQLANRLAEGLTLEKLKELGVPENKPGARGLEERVATKPLAPIVDNAFHGLRKDTAVDVLDRRRYGELFEHPPLPQSEHAAARGRRPHRGDAQLLPLSRCAAAEASEHPFAVHVEVAGCPWNAEHRLARIGIAAKPIDQSSGRRATSCSWSTSRARWTRPTSCRWCSGACSDWSSSLARTTRSPWSSMPGPRAWSCRRRRASTRPRSCRRSSSCGPAARPTAARASSSPTTVASQNFIKNGTNRVILATDGDFNVGVTDDDELVELIEAKAKSGVFLSVLGFGMGNIKDGKLEKLADKGNGHYAYIDSPARGLQGPGRGDGLDAGHRRQGRQDPGRVQPREGRPSSG